jgi:hypothetical protein
MLLATKGNYLVAGRAVDPLGAPKPNAPSLFGSGIPPGQRNCAQFARDGRGNTPRTLAWSLETPGVSKVAEAKSKRDSCTIWIADAHRGDGQCFVVRADELLTAFLELESAIWGIFQFHALMHC